MSKEQLVQSVKEILSLVRQNEFDVAYERYRALWEGPGFSANRPEDQRQALRLMVHAKNAPPKKTPKMEEAFRAAVAPLTDLVSRYEEPGDYEMLGMCHLLLGNDEAASKMYRAGLAIERERNPQSDLCGAFMRRISEI